MKSFRRIALIVTLVSAVALSSASARRCEFSEQSFRMVWSFILFRDANVNINIECPATLEGSFHSKTISKVSGQLIGAITRAAVAAFATCKVRRAVEAFSFQAISLPWHMRYDHFLEALPRITHVGVQLVGTGLVVTVSHVNCLYRSTAARPVVAQFLRETGGSITDFISEREISLFEGNALVCPASGVLGEAVEVHAAVTVLGTTTTISVALVP